MVVNYLLCFFPFVFAMAGHVSGKPSLRTVQDLPFFHLNSLTLGTGLKARICMEVYSISSAIEALCSHRH